MYRNAAILNPDESCSLNVSRASGAAGEATEAAVVKMILSLCAVLRARQSGTVFGEFSVAFAQTTPSPMDSGIMPVPAVSANRSRDVDEAQATKARAAVTSQEAAKPKAKSSKMGNKSREQAVLAASTGRGAARRAAGKDINAEEKERLRMEQERQRQEREAAERAKAALLLQGAQLRKAAATGNADECRRLIGEGFPLDACDSLGRSALHLAALGDHTEVMLVLLDAGIDIDAQDQRGMTALALAAEAGRCDALCTLIDDGADVYIAAIPLTHCWTPIMHAAARGHDEILGSPLLCTAQPNSHRCLLCAYHSPRYAQVFS